MMATKEKTGVLRFPRRDRVSMTRRALLGGVEAGVSFLLGAVLAGAELFGIYSPFGVAAVAAAGSGSTGLCTVAGACLGYLCLEGLEEGVRYAAASILTYSVAFAFFDTKAYRQNWFMPAIAALLSATTGIVCRAGEGWWHGQDLVFFVTEVCFTGGAAFAYRVLFRQWPDTLTGGQLTPRQTMGVLTLGATLLMALARVEVLGTVSLGRMLAGVGILIAARRGPAAGVLTGACAGVALDLTRGGTPYCSMVYALAGLAGGLCWEKRKWKAALAYVGVASAAVLWTWDGGAHMGVPMEAVVGAIAFLVLPLPARRQEMETSQPPLALPGEDGLRDRLRAEKLKNLADAFHSLCEALRTTPETAEDPAKVFTRTADKVCCRCALRLGCWHREYETTRSALNDATTPMLARGRALATDFPGTFSGRCVHFPEFLGEVNRQLTAFLRRRQSLRQTAQARGTLQGQYAVMDGLIRGAAAQLTAAVTPDLPRQQRLTAFLESLGLGPGVVYYDEAGRLWVETPVDEELTTRSVHQELEEVLHIPLEPGKEEGDRLRFVQAEPFRVIAAVDGQPKAGQTVSGDTGTWFRREDGVLFVLLCDGAGTGPEARGESTQAAGLLRKFLLAGMEPRETLETVSTALSLRGEGSATVDLLAVDLYSGKCDLYKQGAAPSYISRGGKVRQAGGVSLPVGIVAGPQAGPHVQSFRAQPGDWLLLLSDGILCGREDDWLRGLLATHEGTSPRDLAVRILNQSRDRYQGEDDSTVIAIRLESRA